MKLVYILKWFPKASETFVLDEILAHQRAGVSLSVFSLLRSPDIVHQDYLHEMHYPVQYVPDGSMEEQAEWIAGHCAGATHIHAHFAAVATTVADLVSRRSGVPFSFTAHARDIYHEAVDLLGLAEKLGHARFCITISQYNRDYLHSLNSEADVRVLYTGLSLGRFPYNPRPRESFVLGMGRLVAKKGFSCLVEACPERYPLHIIGEGPERFRLRGAQLHGFLPRTVAQEWLCRAGLLAVPCCVAHDGDRDGIPTVLLEGMATGTPVIASRVVGIPEVCNSLVEPDDPGQLRVAIEQMMRCPPSQDMLWQRRRWIETHCDVDRQMQLFRSFL